MIVGLLNSPKSDLCGYPPKVLQSDGWLRRQAILNLTGGVVAGGLAIWLVLNGYPGVSIYVGVIAVLTLTLAAIFEWRWRLTSRTS
jgi:hypothetical protein